MAAEMQRLRFTVEAYHRMEESGILTEDDRVELIDGEIVVMSPIGGSHVACINRLTELLVLHAGDRAIVSIQNPVRLDAFHEPEPDVVALRRRNYGDELPAADDVLLVLEISRSSLAYDREVKVPLYARAGIPEVWIVDLEHAVIVRYTEPIRGHYRQSLSVDFEGELASTVLEGLVLRASDVFA